MKIKAADKYFAYVGKHFPVMCASGAFPLMPPVAEAARWLDRFDDLSAKGIARHCAKLTKFKGDFETLATKTDHPPIRAAARALALSAGGAAAELESIRTWEKAPELYLQVAFTGLDHAAAMPSSNQRAREKRFIKRLKGLPALLRLAPDNIEAISATSRSTAQTMIRDCARFLTELGQSDLGRAGKAPRHLDECLAALRDYDRFVASRPEVAEPEGPSFSSILTQALGSDAAPADIFDMAKTEFNGRLDALHDLEPSLGADWKSALADYGGPEIGEQEALDAVVKEVHALRRFVFETALPGVFAQTPLSIETQPLHLASTLRPIHHDPALGAWDDERSRCYVSSKIFSGRGFRDDEAKLRRMRREYPFVAARQTYPGRHLLDSQRRALGDSPMSQVVNPLFMAGWLAFAENLLNELGYLATPQDQLVHHHRGLMRAALAMLDAGLADERLDQDRSLAILKDAGFSTEEALNRVRAVRLAPGSRAAPLLGLHEIERLKQDSGMEIGPFCAMLFENGQIPFADIANARK